MKSEEYHNKACDDEIVYTPMKWNQSKTEWKRQLSSWLLSQLIQMMLDRSHLVQDSVRGSLNKHNLSSGMEILFDLTPPPIHYVISLLLTNDPNASTRNTLVALNVSKILCENSTQGY